MKKTAFRKKMSKISHVSEIIVSRGEIQSGELMLS